MLKGAKIIKKNMKKKLNAKEKKAKGEKVKAKESTGNKYKT